MSVACARRERRRRAARPRSERWRAGRGRERCSRWCSLAATAEIVLDGAAGHSPLIPKSPPIAGWLQRDRRAPRLPRLPDRAARLRRRLRRLLAARARPRPASPNAGRSRWSRRCTLIVFAGPILLSTDVFSYIAYARMGVEHGLNPYRTARRDRRTIPSSATSGTTGSTSPPPTGRCTRCSPIRSRRSACEGALWGMKLEALLASAGTLALTWRCARARELDPVWAILAVGANPLYVIYGLGGAHNDLIMLLADDGRGQPHVRSARGRRRAAAVGRRRARSSRRRSRCCCRS